MKKDVEGFGDDDDVVLVWYDQIKNENELRLSWLVVRQEVSERLLLNLRAAFWLRGQN